jgi:hypothetical protein
LSVAKPAKSIPLALYFFLLVTNDTPASDSGIPKLSLMPLSKETSSNFGLEYENAWLEISWSEINSTGRHTDESVAGGNG